VLEAEAAWLGARATELPDDAFPLLNLGSSTESFRRVDQPWIHEDIFAPLQRRGARVIHADLKREPGVDVVGDLLSDDGLAALRAVGARSVLCSNMLEHVADREQAIAAVAALVPPGGYLVLSVPSAFPYHPDPIDTLYRPSPGELAAAFAPSGLEVLEQAEVVGHRAAHYLAGHGRNRMRFAARMAVPFVHPANWLENARWAARRVRAACLVLRRDT
jgi:SAM-dependent methyltransferase